MKNGQAKTSAKLFARLKQAYVSDDRFIEDFTNRPFSKPPIARYVLAEINDYLENDPERMVAERTGRITLEHILPKNPGREWKGAVPKDEDPEHYAERIGNLTLLEKGRNRGLANASFQGKKAKAFSQSSLAINRQLLDYASWTTKEIENRSRQLASTAKQIWRGDY